VALILPRNLCLVFFRDPRAEFTPERMVKVLKDAGLTVHGRSEPFSVAWDDGPALLVSMQRGTQIEAVIRGLVGRRRKFRASVADCDTQIKIELTDLDQTLDEVNTLIQVQSALQAASGGMIYMSWNDSFQSPSVRAVPSSSGVTQLINEHSPAASGDQAARQAGRALTEQGWLSCENPSVMPRFVGERLTERKMRLFACACCRQIWHHISDARSRAAIEIAEQFSDGLATDRQRVKALTAAKSVPVTRDALWPDAACQTLEKQITKYASLVGINAAWTLANDLAPEGRVTGSMHEPYHDLARAQQAVLFREVFGNPFQDVVIDKRWLTPKVVDLAATLYNKRAFDRLPTLAAALLESGCTVQQIVEHCRGPGPHVLGCWAVDLILGKS
jgi:hypothetical protein